MHPLLALIVLALSSTALAQPAPLAAPVTPAQPELPHKDEATATLIAFGGMAVGSLTLAAAAKSDNAGLFWLGVAGLTIGPSAGHVYAGEAGRAAKTTLVRAVSLLPFGFGLLVLTANCYDGPPCNRNDGAAEALMVLGGVLFAGTTLYDVIDSPAAARRANRRQERAWRLAPTVVPASTGIAPALSVIGRF